MGSVLTSSQRLISLYSDYNGVVPEKVDAVAMSHFVTGESSL